jgi:amidohydrolase
VSLVFQPAEEGGGGGERMVQEGALNGTVLGPPIRAMFGLHGWPNLALGCVTTRPGPMLAAADMFQITVRGTGGHAAFPHRGADAVLAGAAIVTEIQQIVARNVDPLDSMVISVTTFHGGTAHNIIPAQIALSGTVRTLSAATQALAQRRLHEVVTGVAAAHGCDATLDYNAGYPVTCNDPEAVETFRAAARRAVGDASVQTLAAPVMGAEDFAYYGRAVPACFFFLGLRPPAAPSVPQLHQAEFDFNDDAIATGVEMFCELAMSDTATKRRSDEGKS